MKVEELLASGFTCTESFLLISCIDTLPSQWRKQLKFTKKETWLLRVMRHNFGYRCKIHQNIKINTEGYLL